jgi:hypothetical protein
MRLTWLRIPVLLSVLMFPGLLPARAATEMAPEVNTASYSSSLRPMITVRPLPAPPAQQERPKLLDDALYASIAGYRTFDYLSTRYALARGAREVVLPQWVVGNRGTFIAFEGLATASEVGSSVWLIQHRHRRLARAVNMFSVGLGVNTVVHNYDQALWSPVTAGR